MAYEWLEGGYKEEQVGVQDYKNILFLVCVQSVVKVFFFFFFYFLWHWVPFRFSRIVLELSLYLGNNRLAWLLATTCAIFLNVLLGQMK